MPALDPAQAQMETVKVQKARRLLFARGTFQYNSKDVRSFAIPVGILLHLYAQ